MQIPPVKFDVETIIKAQAVSNVVGGDENMSISQNNIPVINLPIQNGVIPGHRSAESFSDFSLLRKTEIFNFFSNLLGNSLRLSPCKPPAQEEKLEDMLSSSIRRAISESLSMGNSVNVSIRGSLTISSEGRKPMTVTFTDGAVRFTTKTTATVTPSKRKAYHPVKYTGSTPSSNSSCSSTVNPPHLSGCTTPSISEPCALDLSKGFSSVPSAQVTPLKLKQTPVAQSSPFNSMALLQPGNLVNLYQTQQNVFGSAPTMLSTADQDSSEIVSGPAKRRRSGSTNVRKSNSTRQFACNQCENVFGSLQDLEEHTTSIHGAYRCHICSAKFTQRSNLQRHALKHVGFKPFECGLCERAYFRKDHLMRHMETTHPGVPARANIHVRLTSSESLDYLSRFVGTGNSVEDVKQANDADDKETRDQQCLIIKANSGPVVDGTRSIGSEDTTKSPESFPVESNLMGLEEAILSTTTPCPDA
ncbi:Zinc finger protein Gfi-1b [Echinococcus granulosus]|uniref:Zinc finger protein n=1 Tax=Echinococcus granulosus TaxID=6210 RepID=U6IWG5_ECHGR|nr:Zinc finger protein Gfi-1b [Echinococcus granulosus]EUB63506.1 Zinc finger protein Gfi-1b [Echinococcus granulosus]KAH9286334.1 Zinc finger protein Gfi-1b [Echinococcus granulosus]CDS16147.1 zinc finger protein [Echinococcus granulosus]